jgi:pyruvate dehydrogenase E2 component (dihydrolipoamide acetyltransferase)
MDVTLPKLGEGADSGIVVNIFVKEGDRIAKDQAILELENEKAVASVPSVAAGTVVKIHVKPGDKISVGQRLITVSEDGKPAITPALVEKKVAQASRLPAPVEEEDEPSSLHFAAPRNEKEDEQVSTVAPVAPPSVRKIARELGIDLNRVRGSQAGGRIGTGDIQAYIARLQKASGKTAPASGTVAAPTKQAAERIDFSKWGPVNKKPLTQLRQVIARRMSESWNTIPRVTQFDEADFTRLTELRKKFAPIYEKKGVRLTLTPFIIKALVETLKKHPVFNSSLDEVANELVFKEYFHIGIAVDTEQGLIVPVVRDADKKSMLELAKDLEHLAQGARDRKITIEELKGGTFTISNQGAIGGAHFTPIVNKPEVAVLGLGRGVMKPVVRDGKVEVCMMTPLALSYDHRVIDGGAAARFIVDLVKAMENFDEEAVKI